MVDTETHTNPVSTSQAAKVTKRKIDEALHSLDDVLRASDTITPPPAKKARFPGSLVATLAKYGIRTKARTLSKGNKPSDIDSIKSAAPKLSAILSRAASKKQKAAQQEELVRIAAAAARASPSIQLDVSEYRPSSIVSFLSRLSTYKLSTYANKPSPIDAVAASRAGWTNEGKDRLYCSICKCAWIVASREGMSREAAEALLEKQRNYLIQNHKDGCPWKSQQCDPSIYCIPMKPPSTMAKEIKLHALELDDKHVLEGVDIRHPLHAGQFQSLQNCISSVEIPVVDSQPPIEESESYESPEPSEKALLASLFGWTLATPPATPVSRPVTPSVSRPRPSEIALALHGPNTPRKTSASSSISEAGTPGPSGLHSPRPRIVSSGSTSLLQKDKDSTLIQCHLCQRRIGLWAFKHSRIPVLISTTDSTESDVADKAAVRARRLSQLPKKDFDLLKEHRSYCPYVVRSTTIPSLSQAATHTIPNSSSADSQDFDFSFRVPNAPLYPANESNVDKTSVVEGWRAVLTVVLRKGLVKRQRQRTRTSLGNQSQQSPDPAENADSQSRAGEEPNNQDDMETDGIQAMVTDVKAHGGKHLLKYVKSLFV